MSATSSSLSSFFQLYRKLLQSPILMFGSSISPAKAINSPRASASIPLLAVSTSRRHLVCQFTLCISPPLELIHSPETDMASSLTWTRYGQSKLANILFTRTLASKYPTASLPHPCRNTRLPYSHVLPIEILASPPPFLSSGSRLPAT